MWDIGSAVPSRVKPMISIIDSCHAVLSINRIGQWLVSSVSGYWYWVGYGAMVSTAWLVPTVASGWSRWYDFRCCKNLKITTLNQPDHNHLQVHNLLFEIPKAEKLWKPKWPEMCLSYIDWASLCSMNYLVFYIFKKNVFRGFKNHSVPCNILSKKTLKSTLISSIPKSKMCPVPRFSDRRWWICIYTTILQCAGVSQT